jgi:hypothetical protein
MVGDLVALVSVRRFILPVLAVLAPWGCKARATEVVVFHASSLSAVLGEAAEAFQKAIRRLRIRLEPSGSQVAVRKVTELGHARRHRRGRRRGADRQDDDPWARHLERGVRDQ